MHRKEHQVNSVVFQPCCFDLALPIIVLYKDYRFFDVAASVERDSLVQLGIVACTPSKFFGAEEDHDELVSV